MLAVCPSACWIDSFYLFLLYSLQWNYIACCKANCFFSINFVNTAFLACEFSKKKKKNYMKQQTTTSERCWRHVFLSFSFFLMLKDSLITHYFLRYVSRKACIVLTCAMCRSRCKLQESEKLACRISELWTSVFCCQTEHAGDQCLLYIFVLRGTCSSKEAIV